MGLPAGTVTMLFSDLEGSTKLLGQLGDRYGEVLSAQRALLRAAFSGHGGTELGTEGDSFFVVFASAIAAVTACAEAQRALVARDWPGGLPPRVRMGLHTGEPTRHEDGYIGMDVHRAARISAAAHGGQVVLSDATRQLIDGRLPGVGLADLGWHRLKDIAEPEHLHQLVIEGLPSEFPPLRSLGNRTTLPAPPTPLVGRAGQLQDAAALLSAAAPARLITLTGPGGIGKTRLALAAAAAIDREFPDGVYFVPLASVTEAAVMWTTIAEAIGVTGDGRSPPAFFEHIRHRHALLLLDNLEQLPGAADVVAELMAVAPQVTVLATSRRPLRVPGEQEYPVPPLPVPGSFAPSAEPAGAIELFVQQARLARPDFALTEQNAAEVAAICERLDGLPLAVELAAARIRLLSPRALLAQLDRSLEFQAGAAGRPGRQRTLRDTVAWSYDLLSGELQAAFRRMGTFAGGCDLASVTAVAAGDADAFDRMADLADASLLVVRDGPDGEPRIGMLQTVRAFAVERLEEAGELDEARRAHASFYVGLAEDIAPQLQGPLPLTARDRLEAELDNFRVALGWCLPDQAPERMPRERAALGLQLCRAMNWFWYAFGYTAEGHGWQRRAVAAAAGEGGAELATALHGLAILLLQQGETAEARDALTACLEIWRQENSRDQMAMELCSLGVAHWTLGDLETGRKMLWQSIEIARETGDESRESTALSNLGVIEIGAGQGARAIELLEQSQVIDRKLGNVWGHAISQSNLALAMLRAGQTDDAHDSLQASAPELFGLGDIELTIDVIELFAVIFAARGDQPRAARMIGTAQALREQAGMPMRDSDAALIEEYIGPARESITPLAWDEQRRKGRARSPQDALADATAARSSKLRTRTCRFRPDSIPAGGRNADRQQRDCANPPPLERQLRAFSRRHRALRVSVPAAMVSVAALAAA